MGLYDLEDPEEIQAFKELENLSPRAMGIVAGALVERRLTAVIQSRMRNPTNSKERELLKSLFLPSGALGTFSTKIAVAYLLDLVPNKPYKDLEQIKEIRNRFAHDISCHDFDGSEIRNRVNNLNALEVVKKDFIIEWAGYRENWDTTPTQTRFRLAVQVILWSLMRILSAPD